MSVHPVAERAPTYGDPPALDELLSGASLIADPWGNLLAGPVSGREEILYADCDLGQIIAARRVFDTAGHYRRPDVERAWEGPPATP